MITLKPVDKSNYIAIIKLSVHEIQQDFVAPNVFSLAQSKVQPECIPMAIYNDQTLVGFALYCMDEADQEFWIYRLMIGKEFQGNGYGRQALIKLVEHIQSLDPLHQSITISFEPDNIAAKTLYESCGFIPDGRIEDGEIVYMLKP